MHTCTFLLRAGWTLCAWHGLIRRLDCATVLSSKFTAKHQGLASASLKLNVISVIEAYRKYRLTVHTILTTLYYM